MAQFNVTPVDATFRVQVGENTAATLRARDEAEGFADDAAASAALAQTIIEAAVLPEFRYQTRAAANAAVGGLANGAAVLIYADESYGQRPTMNEVVGGAVVWRATLYQSPVTFYCDSENGNDANNGLSLTTAKRTLAAARALMSNGDKLALVRNSRWRESVSFAALSSGQVFPVGGGRDPIISARDVVSSFTAHSGGPAYTFTVNLPAASNNRAYPGVWEDGERLTEIRVGDTGIADAAAAIAAVIATPGTFYFAGPGGEGVNGWAAGVKTFYIHASDGSNPNTNGKLYETHVREVPLTTGANKFSNIIVHFGLGHDGIVSGGPDLEPELENMTLVGAGRHNSLINASSWTNTTIIAPDPRRTGTAFHANMDTSEVKPFTTIKGLKFVGDRRGFNSAVGEGRTTLFYNHADFSLTAYKEGWIISDVEADFAGTLFEHPNCRLVIADNLELTNIRTIHSANTSCDYLVSNISARMSAANPDQTGLSFMRPLAVYAGRTFEIANGRFDVQSDSFIAGTEAADFGTIVLRNTEIVTRSSTSGAANTLFINHGEAATYGMEGLVLDRCRIAVAPGARQGNFASLKFLTSCNITDLHLIGLYTVTGLPQRDPNFVLDGVNTPLSTVQPGARCIWADWSRTVQFEDEFGVRLKYGAYQPGNRIWSGAAFSEPGATQPRAHIIVGDVIASRPGNASIFITLTASNPHQNAVGFVSDNATSQFVSVGQGGSIYSINSVFGGAPTARTSGTTAHLRSVCGRSNGVIVAGGDGGVLVRSTDFGATWTVLTSGTTKTVRGIATDGTTWVAVADDATVGTSTNDGATWTWGTVGSDSFYAARWDAARSLFVIGGNNGALYTSPATISWTSRDTGTRNRIVTFAGMPEGIMAGLYQTSETPSPCILTSTNGTAWVPHPEMTPFEIRAMTGSGSSTFEDRALVVAGESQVIATARSMMAPLKYVDTWAAQNPSQSASTLKQELAAVS